MKPWRCQICGETYLGEEPTDRCPYCGAAGKNLISPAEYQDYGQLEMSKKSREDCLHTLKLELNNAAFYKKCAELAENQISRVIFKRLSKHEQEHAELIADMLGIEEGEFPQVEVPESDPERFAEAHDHELGAINFYLKVAKEAPEPRMKEVFQALSDIEMEHLRMSNIYR